MFGQGIGLDSRQLNRNEREHTIEMLCHMSNSKDFIQKSLDWLIDQTHSMIEKGYVQAWFSWLEWLFITSLILVVAQKTNNIFVCGLGAICTVLLFFVGLAGVEKIRDETAVSFWDKRNGLRLFAVAITLIGMWVVMGVIFVLLPASLA